MTTTLFATSPLELLAAQIYNDLHVPQLFVLAPIERYNDPEHFPWTMGLTPTYCLDGQTHAPYVLAHKPDARIATCMRTTRLPRRP
jgi:branched-chain amino acid transport system substrate-binding protein